MLTNTLDCWLDGKLLPKGSEVIVNIYGLHHDEERYLNHDVFDPSRFLNKPALADEYAHTPDYEQRDHYAYGVGRRLCPGIHLAERALFKVVSKLLWGFEFTTKMDHNGKPIKMDISSASGYSDGLTIGPLPFECDIKVRSEKRKQTILEEYAEMEREIFPDYQVPKE